MAFCVYFEANWHVISGVCGYHQFHFSSVEIETVFLPSRRRLGTDLELLRGLFLLYVDSLTLMWNNVIISTDIKVD